MIAGSDLSGTAQFDLGLFGGQQFQRKRSGHLAGVFVLHHEDRGEFPVDGLGSELDLVLCVNQFRGDPRLAVFRPGAGCGRRGFPRQIDDDSQRRQCHVRPGVAADSSGRGN
jgi:hypothetical protein